ncbi:hypothetical protein QBC40DRAFT_261599 [Triangularia verruculosa]|uniref:Uncharacterized protein n=1 Tax=Triangularia verruculosa TaxID=2587418 RepID=A0AAN6XPY8_9PEZI|nr:hypothetical protein QBC40DRAFT_261599 [Triangularia verruculosa]
MASSSSAPSGASGTAPLDISGGSSSSSRAEYFNYTAATAAESPTSPASTTTPLFFGRDNNRTTTAAAYGSSPPEYSVKNSVKSARKVNANSYCGRHSDEFLFGGRSIGDLWRAVRK